MALRVADIVSERILLYYSKKWRVARISLDMLKPKLLRTQFELSQSSLELNWFLCSQDNNE